MKSDKSNNSKFIATFNPNTAELLNRMGFQQITKMDNGYFIFINKSDKLMFTNLKDIVFTDKMLF